MSLSHPLFHTHHLSPHHSHLNYYCLLLCLSVTNYMILLSCLKPGDIVNGQECFQVYSYAFLHPLQTFSLFLLSFFRNSEHSNCLHYSILLMFLILSEVMNELKNELQYQRNFGLSLTDLRYRHLILHYKLKYFVIKQKRHHRFFNCCQ